MEAVLVVMALAALGAITAYGYYTILGIDRRASRYFAERMTKGSGPGDRE